jgi:O-antigen ligase
VAALDERTHVRPGVLQLYGVLWATILEFARRYRVALLVEATLILAWFTIRTLAGVDGRPYLAWTIATCSFALLSPRIGLIVLVATVPFYEPFSISAALGMRHLLVASLGIAVGVRIVAGGWRQVPRSPALMLGAALAIITAASVGHTIADFDSAFSAHATQMWLATIGGAIVLLIVGAWVARNGETRHLLVAIAACGLAASLSLVEVVHRGLVSDGALSWIGNWKDFGTRVSGIIPAPNAVAALLLPPATAALAGVLPVRGYGRTAVATVGVALAAAAVLTFSRAAIVGLYALAVIAAWRRRRAAGVVLLGLGLLVGVLAVPLFIQFRAGLQGVSGDRGWMDWILGADEARFVAWGAAVRMWLAEPLVGHGFLSYKVLGDTFGDPRLGSPHNELLRLFAEEGVVGGVVGIAFVAALVRELARVPGMIGAGLLAGAVGYWTVGMFNNPLLFIQVSAMAFVFAGYGLHLAAHRQTKAEAAVADAQSSPRGRSEGVGARHTRSRRKQPDSSSCAPPTRRDATRRYGVPGAR